MKTNKFVLPLLFVLLIINMYEFYLMTSLANKIELSIKAFSVFICFYLLYLNTKK